MSTWWWKVCYALIVYDACGWKWGACWEAACKKVRGAEAAGFVLDTPEEEFLESELAKFHADCNRKIGL